MSDHETTLRSMAADVSNFDGRERDACLAGADALAKVDKAIGFYTDTVSVTLLGMGMHLEDAYRDIEAMPESLRRRDALNSIHNVLEVLKLYHADTAHAQRCPWNLAPTTRLPAGRL